MSFPPKEAWSQHGGVSLGFHEETEDTENKSTDELREELQHIRPKYFEAVYICRGTDGSCLQQILIFFPLSYTLYEVKLINMDFLLLSFLL